MNYCFKVQQHGCQRAFLSMWEWTVNERRAGMRPAEASRCLSQLQEGPRYAATCPCTSVCSPSSSQWHPRLRSSPLPPRLSCTWLAWKNMRTVSRLSSPLALWCLKCDCSWIVAAFPWRFWHEKQAGLSGLSHGQWSGTKTISLLTVGYYYQGERGTKHRGFLSHEIHFPSKLQTHFRCADWIIPIYEAINRFLAWSLCRLTLKYVCKQPENTFRVCLHRSGRPKWFNICNELKRNEASNCS